MMFLIKKILVEAGKFIVQRVKDDVAGFHAEIVVEAI